MKRKYIIEVRDEAGSLDFEKEKELRKKYPYLFSKSEFTMDELAYYVSYGDGRNNPSGPSKVAEFMAEIGITYRVKYW